MRVSTATLFLFSCLALGCGQPPEQSSPSSAGKLKVGLVYGAGGRGDKSFNDAAFAGLERAQQELGIEIEDLEPGGNADREAMIWQFATDPNISLIFGVGFIFTNDITAAAREFPDKKFACIDYAYNPSEPLPENLSAILFREEEGSYLVGALAALVSKTGKIGFVGGMESPLIRRFEQGYFNGAKAVRPETEVLSGYAGLDETAFKNPAKGKELALSQYGKGADIIYHASGVTGLGVFEAAIQQNKFAIGVDMNQETSAPGHILTSMVKVLDNAVFQTVKELQSGNFKGGTANVLGLAAKGVDYVYNDNNRAFISDSVHRQVEALREKIVRGEINVLLP